MRIDVKGTIVSDSDAWVYEWFGIECCNPKKINDAVSKAAGQALDVYINSGGGSIFAGSEIYAALREYSGPVNIHVVGLAASAASVVACAGYSDIAPTAMLMVHNVSSAGTSGDYHVMDKQSETLQKANETIAAAYVEKTGMSMKAALEMMDRETWLSAEDAVKAKLVDKISEPKNTNLVNAYNCTVLPDEVVEKIRNMVKHPPDNSAGFFTPERDCAQAKINFLNLKARAFK